MGKDIKVLLVTSISGMDAFKAPAVGLLRIKSYLLNNGFYCDVLHMDLSNNLKTSYLEKVSNGYYNIIGFSVSHTNMKLDLDNIWDFVKASKNSDVRPLFVAGGQEASMNYEEWLKASIDLVILGYGEYPFLHICNKMGKWDGELDIFSDTNGIVYRKKNADLYINYAEPLTQEKFEYLSYNQLKNTEIPFTEFWDDFREEAKRLVFNNNKFYVENIRLYTSSHCGNGCGFCSSQTFLRSSQNELCKIIMLSAFQVYDLVIGYIQKFGAKSFLFNDDDFIVSNKEGILRTKEFCNLIIRGKEKGEIPKEIIFNLQTKVRNFLNKEKEIEHGLIDLMKKAGFHSIGLGVETFSNRLLTSVSVNKGKITQKDCINVILALSSAGLTPQVNLIFGIPESTIDDLIETINIAIELIKKGIQVVTTSKMRAFPGAPIMKNNSYSISEDIHINPFSGECIKETKFIIPKDSKIEYMVDHLEEEVSVVLERLRENSKWKSGAIPKSLISIANFIAALKLIDNETLSLKIENELEWLYNEEGLLD